MLGLLYFGRLEPEKGFDGIIDMIELFTKNNKELPFEIFIFGAGSGEKKIMQLASTHKGIHFFGRTSHDTIKRYISNCQYCLMPSECLESFGISALNAMKRGGLPIIGYAKGGLKDFIAPTLDLTRQHGTTTGEKLHTLINKLITKPLVTSHLSSTKEGSSPVTEQYSIDRRIVNFHALAGKNVKKVLIVSDFVNRIGGLETYINGAKENLDPHGYEVELFGQNLPSGIIGKLAKYCGIVTGLANFREAIKLQRKIKKMKPDLIRYNSVMRYLGRMPVLISKHSSAKKWMMFHDLGYFAPFPSKITSEEQIKTPFTLTHFLASNPTKNPLKRLAIIGKYIQISLIKNQLKKRMDTFLVPSTFMKEIVHKSYKISDEKIKIFPHFIQE